MHTSNQTRTKEYVRKTRTLNSIKDPLVSFISYIPHDKKKAMLATPSLPYGVETYFANTPII